MSYRRKLIRCTHAYGTFDIVWGASAKLRDNFDNTSESHLYIILAFIYGFVEIHSISLYKNSFNVLIINPNTTLRIQKIHPYILFEIKRDNNTEVMTVEAHS